LLIPFQNLLLTEFIFCRYMAFFLCDNYIIYFKKSQVKTIFDLVTLFFLMYNILVEKKQ